MARLAYRIPYLQQKQISCCFRSIYLDNVKALWRMAAPHSSQKCVGHEPRTSVRSVATKFSPQAGRSCCMKTSIQTNRAVHVIAIFMFFLVWVSAEGQTTNATLSGVVHDPTSAVVSQAKITIKNTVKGTVRVSSTAPSRRYSFTLIHPATS